MNDTLTVLNSRLPFKSIFAIQEIHDLSPRLLNQLSEKERQKLESIPNEKRRREYASSRELLRQLALKWNLPVDEFSVYKNELGNPFAETASAQFNVSIAHTDEMVFGGLSLDEPIGIDMEPMNRKVSDCLRERMMHPAEKRSRLEISTIRLWTIKEAYVKLRGQGMRLNMNDIYVQQREEDYTINLSDCKKAKVCSFKRKDNWLAIAYYL